MRSYGCSNPVEVRNHPHSRLPADSRTHVDGQVGLGADVRAVAAAAGPVAHGEVPRQALSRADPKGLRAAPRDPAHILQLYRRERPRGRHLVRRRPLTRCIPVCLTVTHLLGTNGSPGSTSSSTFYGGGSPKTISAGSAFAGRQYGGATRGSIASGGRGFGSGSYGSGYGASRGVGGFYPVAGLGFAFGYWPLVRDLSDFKT